MNGGQFDRVSRRRGKDAVIKGPESLGFGQGKR